MQLAIWAVVGRISAVVPHLGRFHSSVGIPSHCGIECTHEPGVWWCSGTVHAISEGLEAPPPPVVMVGVGVTVQSVQDRKREFAWSPILTGQMPG
jgi:hypothetical protein